MCVCLSVCVYFIRKEVWKSTFFRCTNFKNYFITWYISAHESRRIKLAGIVVVFYQKLNWRNGCACDIIKAILLSLSLSFSRIKERNEFSSVVLHNFFFLCFVSTFFSFSIVLQFWLVAVVRSADTRNYPDVPSHFKKSPATTIWAFSSRKKNSIKLSAREYFFPSLLN